jgi:hypothetical protein
LLPVFLKEAITGITPQEQSGKGTPIMHFLLWGHSLYLKDVFEPKSRDYLRQYPRNQKAKQQVRRHLINNTYKIINKL